MSIALYNITEEEGERYPHIKRLKQILYEEEKNTETDPIVGFTVEIISVANELFDDYDNSKDLLKTYNKILGLIENLSPCKYVSGRTHRYNTSCKGSTHPRLVNLLEFTAECIGFCKEKDPTLFTDAESMELLNSILHHTIVIFGLYTLYTPSVIIEPFIKKINTILGEERVLFRCDEKGDEIEYTCARAVGMIPCEKNKENPGYILVYNTVSKTNDEPSLQQFLKEWNHINETLCKPKVSNSSSLSSAGVTSLNGGKRKKTKKVRKAKRLTRKQKK